MATRAEYASGGVGIGLRDTLPVFEHAAGCARLGRSDTTALDIGRVPVLDFMAADDVGERAPLPLLPGPADDVMICRACIERDNKGTPCLLYTSDAADDLLCVDLGGRRIIK